MKKIIITTLPKGFKYLGLLKLTINSTHHAARFHHILCLHNLWFTGTVFHHQYHALALNVTHLGEC
jgi:hypothetical protein